MSTNSFSVTANPNDTIYLRDPSGSKIGEPVKALLDEAYKELGFKTKYINHEFAPRIAREMTKT